MLFGYDLKALFRPETNVDMQKHDFVDALVIYYYHYAYQYYRNPGECHHEGTLCPVSFTSSSSQLESLVLTAESLGS